MWLRLYARLSPIRRRIMRCLWFATLIIKTRQGIITILREILAHGLHMPVGERSIAFAVMPNRKEVMGRGARRSAVEGFPAPALRDPGQTQRFFNRRFIIW